MCAVPQCLEQSNLLQRLGPWRLFTPGHASCHWVLDLSNPGHEEVAKRLVGLAVAGGELPNFWNIRLRGGQTYSSSATACTHMHYIKNTYCTPKRSGHPLGAN